MSAILTRVARDYGGVAGPINALMQTTSPNSEGGYRYNSSTKTFEIHDGVGFKKLFSINDAPTSTDLAGVTPEGVLTRGVANTVIDDKILASKLTVAAGSQGLLEISSSGEISLTALAIQKKEVNDTITSFADFISTVYDGSNYQDGDTIFFTNIDGPGGSKITEVYMHNSRTNGDAGDWIRVETPNADADSVRSFFRSGPGLSYSPANGEFSIASEGIVSTMLKTSTGAGQVNAKIIPLDPTGNYQGTATDVQASLEELESTIGTLSSSFLKLDGTSAMTGNIDMQNNRLVNTRYVIGQTQLTLNGNSTGAAQLDLRDPGLALLTGQTGVSISSPLGGITLNGPLNNVLFYKNAPNNMEAQAKEAIPHLGYLKDGFARIKVVEEDLPQNTAVEVSHGYDLQDPRDLIVQVWDGNSPTDVAIETGTNPGTILVTSNDPVTVQNARIVMAVFSPVPVSVT